ncbi:unnamed protein product [Lactuca virosa]|uniref:Uncharacterized protein n=1 Tax=Lactuca virosa TaxID=75947 RepID=A0AAU9N1B2_9ASTR|nr:unnamed protein product [Lactuca virosa]
MAYLISILQLKNARGGWASGSPGTNSATDYGLCVDNKIQEKMLGRLRYKYLDKLMMSDFNVMKQTFVKHYATVKKMVRFKRMKLIEEKKKEITSVLQ